MTKRKDKIETFYVLGVYALEYDEEYEGIIPLLLFKEAFISRFAAKEYAKKFNDRVRPTSKPIVWSQTTYCTESSTNTGILGFEIREKEAIWEKK